MRKKKILTILILMIPLLFTIGFSSWIIMYSFEFSPSYKTNPVSDLFDFSYTTTYNGQEQVPSPKDGVTITGDIAYQYKLESESTFTTGKPINAGVYDVKITISNSTVNGTCQVKFTINKVKIKFSASTININYGDCVNTWSAMLINIKSKVTFKDENNNDLTDFDFANHCQLLGMHNGLYYYGESGYKVNGLTTTTYVAGSTYVGEVILYDEVAINYEFINGDNKLLIKYKTAIVGGSYCTIEEAIRTQGNPITLAGDYSSNTSYIETVFCCLTEAEGNPYTKAGGYYTEDSVNYPGQKVFKITSGYVLVPYENSTNYYLENNASSSTSRVYSCLNVPSSIALVFSSGTELRIGGVLNTSGYIGYRGVVMNNGTITFESSSMLYSYGFLKGTGIVNMKSGSTAYDIMRMFDWPGGSAGSSMAGSAFPIIAWSCHNISCPTKFYKGSTLMGYSSLSVTLIGYQKPSFCVIGSSSSTVDCLFRPSSSSKSTDYIIKAGSSNNNLINTSITESNQTQGQKDVIIIDGNYEDNSLKISVSIYTFQTSTSKAVPISYMDITIASGGMLTISTSSYVFLLGTSVTVEENAILNVSGSAFVVFDRMSGTTKDTAIVNPWFGANYCTNAVNSVLILNGSLTGTGTVAGNIITETAGAQLSISTYNKSSLTMKKDASSAGEVLTETFNSYGDIGDTSSFSYTTFANGTSYVSTTLDAEEVVDKDYYFTAATNVKTFVLKFYDTDKTTLLGTRNIQVLLPNDDGNYIYVLNGMEYEPFKIHYDFEEWYFISNSNLAAGTTLTYNLSDSTANTYSFYASWVEHEYILSYSAGYAESLDSTEVEMLDTVVYSNTLMSFTISNFVNNKITITTTATYNDKYFNGWYVGVDASTGVQLTELTISNIELFVETYGADMPIPLYCQFTNYAYFTINFVDNEDNFTNPESVVCRSDQNISLPNTASYDSNALYQRYFTYWSFLSSPTEATKVTNNSSVQYLINQIKEYNSAQGSTVIDLSNNQITLYAKLSTKAYTLTYQQVDYYGTVVNTSYYYYNAGGQYEVPSDLSLTGYVLNTSKGTSGVEYTGGTTTNGIITVNSNITIKVHYYKIITLTVSSSSSGMINAIDSFTVTVDKYYDGSNVVVSAKSLTSAGTITTIQGASITTLKVTANYTQTATAKFNGTTLGSVSSGLSKKTYTHSSSITLTDNSEVVFSG